MQHMPNVYWNYFCLPESYSSYSVFFNFIAMISVSMGTLFSSGNSDRMDSATASTSSSDTTILDLDDSCLRNIFKQLVLADLCTLADVCQRFRHVSQSLIAAFENETSFINASNYLGSTLYMREWGVLKHGKRYNRFGEYSTRSTITPLGKILP